LTPHDFETLKKSLTAGAETYATNAKTWHILANDAASYSPRIATFLREYAASLEALAALGKDLGK
jgi:hypothetical protein